MPEAFRLKAFSFYYIRVEVQISCLVYKVAEVYFPFFRAQAADLREVLDIGSDPVVVRDDAFHVIHMISPGFC